MTFIEFSLSNKAYTILTAGIDASDTSLAVAGGNLSLFPAVLTDGEFNAYIWNGTDYKSPLTDPDAEVVTVTANAASPWTIRRPAAGNDYNNEGSGNIAATHNTAGKTYYIALTPTAGVFNKLKGLRQFITVGPAGTRADYVCDGTADDVEIQAAINKANVSSVYRGVLLLGGTYDITATIQKYQVALVGVGKDVVTLSWTGAGSSSIITTGNDEGGYIGYLTIDGGAIVDGNTGFVPNANIDHFIFDSVVFKDCAIGIDQDGGVNKQMWDSAAYDCQFTGCGIGILFSEFQFKLYNPLIDSNDVGIQLETNSNARVIGGTFTQNGTDIYIDNHCSGAYLSNVWLEESVDYVLNANSARTNWVKNIVFDSCHLSTASVTTFVDCTYMKGLIQFKSGYITEVTGPTSTTVTAGADSIISYEGCQKIDVVGAVTWPGNWVIPNILTTNTINEFTSGSGVTIDGMLCKDGGLSYTGAMTLAPSTGVTNLLKTGVDSELRIFGSGGGSEILTLSHDSSNGYITTSTGSLIFAPVNATASFFKSGSNSYFKVFGPAGTTDYLQFEHDATNAIISTGAGDLYINPTGGNILCQQPISVDIISEYTGAAGVTIDGVQLIDDQIRSLVLKSGATQVAAGAATGELWSTSSHASLPDNVVMVGV